MFGPWDFSKNFKNKNRKILCRFHENKFTYRVMKKKDNVRHVQYRNLSLKSNKPFIALVKIKMSQ